jgi:hypothetical protein
MAEEKVHPWANELSICQRLISYCEYLQPKTAAPTQQSAVTEETKQLGKNLVLMASKNQRDSELTSGWTVGPSTRNK